MCCRNTLVIGFGLILATLLLQCQEIDGKEFLVGDGKGWSNYPGISHWPKGKSFVAGDILIFKYNNTNTSVRRFYKMLYKGYSEECYATCVTLLCPSNDFNSGEDHLVLKEGTNYFISSDYVRCSTGFKIEVHVDPVLWQKEWPLNMNYEV